MKKTEVRRLIREIISESKKSDIKKEIQKDIKDIDGVRYVEPWGDGAIVGINYDKFKSLVKLIEKVGYKVINIYIGFDYNSKEQQMLIKK